MPPSGSNWEARGHAPVPLTWKMAHKSMCRMIRNGPLKISKSLKIAENGPFGINLFPITVLGSQGILTVPNFPMHKLTRNPIK